MSNDQTVRTAARRYLEAVQKAHHVYPSTAVCWGGAGGRMMTPHCAVVCENPAHRSVQDELRSATSALYAALDAPPDAEPARTEPTKEQATQALINDAWLGHEEPLTEDDLSAIARAVLALLPPQRCAPSGSAHCPNCEAPTTTADVLREFDAAMAAHDAEVRAKALRPIRDLLDSEDRSNWVMAVVQESELRAAVARAERGEA